jgi:hypothetical protein
MVNSADSYETSLPTVLGLSFSFTEVAFGMLGPLIPSLSASSHKTGTQFDAFFKEALKACPCLLQLAANIHTKWITDGILKGKVSMSRNTSHTHFQ